MNRRERDEIGRRLMAYRAAVRAWVCKGGVSEDEAEDAVQEVFAAAVARWADYDHETDLGAWLFGIARRVASNWRRTKRRKPSEPWEWIELFTGPSHEERVIARVDLRALPEHLRPLFEAMAEDNFSIAAGARALGVDPDAVKLRLVEIRKRMPVLPLSTRGKNCPRKK